MTTCKILPTHDTRANAVALQTALDTHSCVYVDGVYRLDRPLRVPKSSRLVGVGSRNYIGRLGGADSREFIIEVAGGTRSCPLTNLHISGSGVCRGVRWSGCDNSALYRDLRISECIGLSAAFDNCWVCYGSNLQIANGTGVALKMYQCNSSQFDTIAIRIHTCQKDGQNEQWPDELPQDKRGAFVVLQQDLTTVTNLLFEPVWAGDYPTIYLEASTFSASNVRFEATHHSDAMVRIANGNMAKRGTNIAFDRVLLFPHTKPRTFISANGRTAHLQVRNLQDHAQHLTESLYRFEGGYHVSPIADCCFVSQTLELAKCESGAIVKGGNVGALEPQPSAI